MNYTIHTGDSLNVLKTMPDESVQCCVTSPPYWGLRDYGVDGQIGFEQTPEEYVDKMTSVFREVRRVLKDDGVLWLNIGDSYNGSGKGGNPVNSEWSGYVGNSDREKSAKQKPTNIKSLKPKDLVGIPWMVAFALRDDGWYLRQDIIWAKPNPMPESVRDRCTKAHEYIFLLSKSARYYYDADAISEDSLSGDTRKPYAPGQIDYRGNGHDRNGGNNRIGADGMTRNKRSVWTVATKPFSEAHFATFPPNLIVPCIMGGSREGDTVLDPFSGAGTTGLVALAKNRGYIGIDLNKEYAEMSIKRINNSSPLFINGGVMR